MIFRLAHRSLPLLIAVFIVAGCGGGSDGARIAGDQFRLSGTQRDAQFAVGSESFTEQEVLGNIAIEVLQAADATVIDRTGLGGNEAVRQGLEAGQKSSGDLGVETISDLKRLVEDRPKEATLCLNNDDDFLTRFDGLPGLERAYGFSVPEENLIEMSSDAVYHATEEAEICNFGVVFTTSGFIRELALRLLEDDEQFFAVYNPALTIRQDVFRQYPQLRKIFVPFSEKLDTETLRKLNYAVDVEGKSPENVASTWLRKEGFIE